MECILESSESSGSSSSLPTSSNNSKHLSEPESDMNAQNGQTHQTRTLIKFFSIKLQWRLVARKKNLRLPE